jgi:putative transposase
MLFRHKNVRLPPDEYVGTGWFFVTICCADRRKVFASSKACEWFLKILTRDADAHSFAVHAYCLMPDHIHLLLEGMRPSSDLLSFVRALKTKTSLAYKRRFRCDLWQKKFFDHILRHNDSPGDVAWYIWMNPVRAGLCARPHEYRFVGSFTGVGPNASKAVSDWMPPWRRIQSRS